MNRRTCTPAKVIAAGVVLAMALTACSGGSDDPVGEPVGEPVSGGTFVQAIGGDPGNLDPMHAIGFETWDIVTKAYEALVFVEGDEVSPWLAESWEVTSPTEVVFTVRDDVTCSDGTPFTADTAAANINFAADPANATTYYGTVVNEDVAATADGNTLTVTSKANRPFMLTDVGTILLVCDAGLADPDSLTDATNGTALYALDEVEPGASYTLGRRDDHDWSYDGVTSDTVGLPDQIEVRVITDETTSANLLLSGDVNAAVVIGSERARLDDAGLDFTSVRNPVGEMLFNERSDRVVADPLVREALVTALDREEIGPVIAGADPIEPLSLVTRNPQLCVTDEAPWTLPETSLERAGELLDDAGWLLGDDGLRRKDGEPLTVKFSYNAPTATHAPAAELVAQTWEEIGVTTNLSANDTVQWTEEQWQTYDWDTGWIQLAPGTPAVLSLFFAGNTAEEGGLNFMFVDNPEYLDLAARANVASSPEEACELWRAAEAALVDRVDIFPLTENVLPTYMSGATFEQVNFISPTSIRMMG